MNFGVWFLKTFELKIQTETNLWFKISFTFERWNKTEVNDLNISSGVLRFLPATLLNISSQTRSDVLYSEYIKV